MPSKISGKSNWKEGSTPLSSNIIVWDLSCRKWVTILERKCLHMLWRQTATKLLVEAHVATKNSSHLCRARIGRESHFECVTDRFELNLTPMDYSIQHNSSRFFLSGCENVRSLIPLVERLDGVEH